MYITNLLGLKYWYICNTYDCGNNLHYLKVSHLVMHVDTCSWHFLDFFFDILRNPINHSLSISYILKLIKFTTIRYLHGVNCKDINLFEKKITCSAQLIKKEINSNDSVRTKLLYIKSSFILISYFIANIK